MSFFNALNGGLEQWFNKMAKSKRVQDKNRRDKFQWLEGTPYLVDSAFLLELTDGANKQECDQILDYMYRFNNLSIGEDEHLDILGINSYREIESQIIQRRWK